MIFRATGKVLKASSKTDNSIVAIKLVSLSEKTLIATAKEITFMRDLKHPNTLEYFKCYKKDGSVWVILITYLFFYAI